jgi:ubiquinol-cytochrome c reductase iron-sulfur subunit
MSRDRDTRYGSLASAALLSGSSSVADTTSDPSRRDFLFVATASVGAVGLVAAAVPLVDQMNPDRATIAAGAPISVDISQIAPGQQIQVFWRSKPIMIVNRPPEALKVLQDPKLTGQLSDPDSEVHQQPSYARNWHRSAKPEFVVLVGICTHLGCIPKFYPEPNPTSPAADWLGGYFCPCHGSLYDLAGRVFAGVPAPYNLPVPPYRFENDITIRIGENPPGVDFDLSEIVAL